MLQNYKGSNPPSYRGPPGSGSIGSQATPEKDPPAYDAFVVLPPTYSKEDPTIFSNRPHNNNYGGDPTARASAQYEVPNETVPPPGYEYPRPSWRQPQSGHYNTPGVTLPAYASSVQLEVPGGNNAASTRANVNNEQ